MLVFRPHIFLERESFFVLCITFSTMLSRPVALVVILFTTATLCIKFEPDQVLWNLNQNESARDPLDYWGEWKNHCEVTDY